MEKLYNLINIETDKKEMICLVGAGGKTSVMFRLAQELSSKGKKVLVTTTTAIFYPEKHLYDNILISEDESLNLFDRENSGYVTVFGKSLSPEGKILGANPRFLDTVFKEELFDFILIEGDGSKKRPIKAPAEYEPVIPSCTAKVLGIIGLDSVGKKVCGENVHRLEHFCDILGCREGDVIDTEIVSKLITHESGLFKAAPAIAERYLILNKAEIENAEASAYDIVQKLSDKGCKIPAIISSTKDSSFRNAIKEISGIILAAGLSKRMGVDKLMLPIDGIPIIERVISAASRSRLKEIVLVCGSDKTAAIGGKYGVRTVENTETTLGQSYSVRLGLENSSQSGHGFMFLAGDQPFINEKIINTLILNFSQNKCGAVVPLYNGSRGNPVIFDSSLRIRLMGLCGDSGGRVLLGEMGESVITVDFDDEKPGLDIDTREEYERLLRKEN